MPGKLMVSTNSGNNVISVVAPGIETSKPNCASAKPTSQKTKSSCAEACFDSSMFSGFFEYETPKVVTVQNVPLGILRLLLQILVVSFVVFYQLWYARGYQEFAEVEASVTTKVKGFSRSRLSIEAMKRIPASRHSMYERIWDESDYVVPPAENSAFFVMTNVVLTPNQSRGSCPEDHKELPEFICGRREPSGQVNYTDGICFEGRISDKTRGHGAQTGRCVESDRQPDIFVCEVTSWCPVEIDRLPLDTKDGPLIPGAENYTVFIKNSISFPRFGTQYHRNNMPKGICIYNNDDPNSKLCPIFRLGDIVKLAGGNFTKLAVKGGVIGVDIIWNCDLDWDFEDNCLPLYNFRILDSIGWNFRHAHYHEENRRTLVKAYGLKFLVVIEGQASKFDLKNTVIVLVTGLGLLGLSTMFCDFILLNYSPDRGIVKEKKYETVDTTSRMLQSTLNIMSQTSNLVSMSSFRQPSRSSTSLNCDPSQKRDDVSPRHQRDDVSSHLHLPDEVNLVPSINGSESLNGLAQEGIKNVNKKRFGSQSIINKNSPADVSNI